VIGGHPLAELLHRVAARLLLGQLPQLHLHLAALHRLHHELVVRVGQRPARRLGEGEPVPAITLATPMAATVISTRLLIGRTPCARVSIDRATRRRSARAASGSVRAEPCPRAMARPYRVERPDQ